MANPSETIVRQEDFLAFLKGYTPESRRQGGERDVLAGRWRILTHQPLPELSSTHAKAYAARDEKAPGASLYALVFDDGVPLRQKNITALKNFQHPAMVSLLGDGMMETGAAGDLRYTVVLERPAGQPLSQLLAGKREPYPESTIVQQFLRPLSEVLVAFAKMGISHNRIHPGNLYVSDNNVVLGECISEPSGFSQEPLYEPVERMLAMPRAKADFAPGADGYALAVLALTLTLGFAPFPRANKEILARQLLSNGAYHVLVIPWDVPTGLQDLFRGMLNDARRDRWDAATLESWLAGRRYNLVAPPSLRDTSRGFEFEGETHYTRRSLAHGIWRHWQEADTLFGNNRLSHWLKIQVHKPEVAAAVAKLIGAQANMTQQQTDEALARVIILLDPQGPLRLRQMSFAVEGLGALLAHAVIAERNDDIATLMQILDADLTGFWIEQQKSSAELSALSAKLQKVRGYARLKSRGFGIERVLYDLNPGLPCLSPLVAGRHVMTLADLLTALDTVSPQKAAGEEPGDRHIAAFIASRLDITKEVDLSELQGLPALKTNPTLLMLKLLARAQRKAGERSMKGLSNWLALKLLALLDDIHSRTRQRKLQTGLRAAAADGSLEAVSDLFFSAGTFDADRREFTKAAADYAARKRSIALLQGTEGLSHHADLKGHGVAQSIALGVCLTTVYITLKAYFHL